MNHNFCSEDCSQANETDSAYFIHPWEDEDCEPGLCCNCGNKIQTYEEYNSDLRYKGEDGLF